MVSEEVKKLLEQGFLAEAQAKQPVLFLCPQSR